MALLRWLLEFRRAWVTKDGVPVASLGSAVCRSTGVMPKAGEGFPEEGASWAESCRSSAVSVKGGERKGLGPRRPAHGPGEEGKSPECCSEHRWGERGGGGEVGT